MKRFASSLLYAGRGIRFCAIQEPNYGIQILLALVTLAAGWYFKLSTIEWLLIILSMAIVLGMEMLNTAIEVLCNIVQPDYDPAIKLIKDISAGAVLISAMAALACGLIIFLPRIWLLL